MKDRIYPKTGTKDWAWNWVRESLEGYSRCQIRNQVISLDVFGTSQSGWAKPKESFIQYGLEGCDLGV